MDTMQKKALLEQNIKKMGSIAIAFSGGVDSTFLLKTAHNILDSRAIAITARSSTFTQREFDESVKFCKESGIKQIIVPVNELDIAGFSQNPPDRCYICKRQIFSKIKEAALSEGITNIADGSNVDDLGDYRPGMAALKELQIISPLRDAGLTKKDIRELSLEMGLPTWNKPAYACLASRIPYGEEITKEKLTLIEKAEYYLSDLGFRQFRVRLHGNVARIEVLPGERNKFFDEKFMDNVHDKLIEYGFAYVALDLKGYRTGSMNESLNI